MATRIARRQRVATVAVVSLIMLAEAARASVCGQHVRRLDSSLEYGQPDTSRLGRECGFTRIDRVAVIKLLWASQTSRSSAACRTRAAPWAAPWPTSWHCKPVSRPVTLILEDDFVMRGDPGGANAQVDRFFEDAWPA